MTNLTIITLFAVAVALAPISVDAAFGFAKYATGGGNGAVVRPKTIAELKNYLCSKTSGGVCVDDTPRVIEIDQTFDFRGTMGTATETGCYTKNCGSKSEFGIDRQDYCNGKTKTSVTYDKAGPSPQLMIGSNKTLRGIGSKGTIIGTGIVMKGGVRNIIVQNVAITDINPGIVWGGDAITIRNADLIWIDHVFIARIGRQMITTQDSAGSITISDSHFDGRSPRSYYCDGNHYWNFLFYGTGDITFCGNLLHHMTGRAPKIGTTSSRTNVHIENNYFKDMPQGALTAVGTSNTLIEGNYYENVYSPIQKGDGAVLTTFKDSSNCNNILGRSCIANIQKGGRTSHRPFQIEALNGFAGKQQYMMIPMPASNVPAFVNGFAGTGKI